MGSPGRNCMVSTRDVVRRGMLRGTRTSRIAACTPNQAPSEKKAVNYTAHSLTGNRMHATH